MVTYLGLYLKRRELHDQVHIDFELTSLEEFQEESKTIPRSPAVKQPPPRVRTRPQQMGTRTRKKTTAPIVDSPRSPVSPLIRAHVPASCRRVGGTLAKPRISTGSGIPASPRTPFQGCFTWQEKLPFGTQTEQLTSRIPQSPRKYPFFIQSHRLPFTVILQAEERDNWCEDTIGTNMWFTRRSLLYLFLLQTARFTAEAMGPGQEEGTERESFMDERESFMDFLPLPPRLYCSIAAADPLFGARSAPGRTGTW